MSTNNSIAKQSYPEMETYIQTSNYSKDSYGVNLDINEDDQSMTSYDESLFDIDYDSSDFDDTNMFVEGAAIEESAMEDTAPRVGMPGTHGSGGDLQLTGTQQAGLRDVIMRRNSYGQMQIVPGSIMAIQTTSKPTETKQDKFADLPVADVDPKVLLKSILESHGASSDPRPYASLKEFFVTMTEANVDAYDMETVSAVRNGSLDDVRKLHEAGKNLVACNKFGENIIHLACRHGKTDIVEFLMCQAGCSPRVICDVSYSTKSSYSTDSFQ
jgi:hypothetical protein